MTNLIEIIITAVDKTAAGLSGTQTSLADLGKTATRLGAGLTAGITLPLVGIGLASINAASDLGESLNKVGVVFGENAAAITEWSTTAAQAFGISQQTALEAAGTFGNLFTTMGLGEQETADMSTSLVELASDLASFNNIDPTVALEKLRSGLVGQSEPLRVLGVNLTEASVAAKAIEMGLADANGELSEAAKVTARYALIMEQTTTAQGDFANTSTGLANTTRIMKAQLSDAAATLGAQLLPVALTVVTAISGLVEKFNNLSPAAQKAIVVVGGIAAAVGPLLLIVGQVITAFTAISGLFAAGGVMATVGTALTGIAATAGTALAGITAAAAPVILPIAAIGLAIAALYYVIKTLGPGIVESWSGVWEKAQIIYAHFADELKIAWNQFWLDIGTRLREAWANLVQIATDLVSGIKSAFTIDWSALGTGIITGIKAGITNGINSLIGAVTGAAQSALDAAKALLGIHSPSLAFAAVGQQMMAGMGQGIRAGVSLPVRELQTATPRLLSASRDSVTNDQVQAGHTFNFYPSTNLDVEQIAYRIAEIIQGRRA